MKNKAHYIVIVSQNINNDGKINKNGQPTYSDP